jgi:hypothetical protein
MKIIVPSDNNRFNRRHCLKRQNSNHRRVQEHRPAAKDRDRFVDNYRRLVGLPPINEEDD